MQHLGVGRDTYHAPRRVLVDYLYILPLRRSSCALQNIPAPRYKNRKPVDPHTRGASQRQRRARQDTTGDRAVCAQAPNLAVAPPSSAELAALPDS